MTPDHSITSALQVKYCVLLCGDDIDPHVRQIHLFDDRKFLLNIRSKVVKAASGALAMLSSASNKICNKVFSSYLLTLTLSHLLAYIVPLPSAACYTVPQVFESKQWNDCLLNLLANTDDEIVLRGAVIVQHMVAVSKDVAEKILETQVVICC